MKLLTLSWKGNNASRYCLWLVLAIVLSSCQKHYDTEGIAEQLPEEVDFNYHVKPILSDRCFACHGPDNNARQAELRLDVAESALKKILKEGGHAIVPGNLKKSLAFQRIITDDPELKMPPPESNLELNEHEIAILAKWIEQGAEYKAHWSFITPMKASLPNIQDQNWINNEIDHFILQKLEQQGLNPAPKASKETLLRRITLDLTGLPPSPEEIDAFLQDQSPNAYEAAIDRLMAQPQFGERMALEWLDVARYADSHGYQDDGMRNTWPWRDWLIRTFNNNKPYDDFLVEQLAGDLLPNPSRDQILATCFNRHHPQTQEGGVVEEEYRVEYVADRTNTFGKALLGLTMECARCHDHKYDPLTQKDYFALSAFFNNNNDWGIVPYNGEASPTILLPTPEEEAKLNALRQRIQPLEAAILPEKYIAELKSWLSNSDNPIDLNEGLKAYFDFDEAITIDKSQLNLDGDKNPGWAGIGKKGAITSYINKAKNKPDAAVFGDKDRMPQSVEGYRGKGIRFIGDAGIRFNRDLDFDRHQPFAVSVWVRTLQSGEKGPIFNKTNGDFEGYRGWICKLNEDGTLSFQLNHVWPDNCIDFQTTASLEIGEWTHIAFTYDGSSKASGVGIFINGQRPDLKLHKDNLQKSLLHGVEGSNWSIYPFMVGKEKERSIENFEMDELRVYNRQLATIEVQQLYSNQTPALTNEDQLLQAYLLSGKNNTFNQKLQELTQLRKEENLLMTDFLEVMVMQEKKEPRSTFILDRGAYDAPTEAVEANTPAMLPVIPDTLPKNRLGLAKWLVAADHPLTSRVAVNRFWHMLFGKGLVATQEDFGNQGNLPSHPELLDWLAVHFMENDWDVKAFLKFIMLSSTYQQSSVAAEQIKAQDPGNELYARYPAYRLPAELIRDMALAASELLVDTIGGPSVYPYQPKGIWAALATRNETVYKQGSGDDLYRRSMYTVWKRSSPPPSMMNFDAPDRYYCVVRRQKTATPLQSLVLMNDPQFVEAARHLATKTILENPGDTTQQIDFMLKSLIGREGKSEEKELLGKLYSEELEDLKKQPDRARHLLNIGESPVNNTLSQTELAACTIVASTIMNFDEFVMKR